MNELTEKILKDGQPERAIASFAEESFNDLKGWSNISGEGFYSLEDMAESLKEAASILESKVFVDDFLE